MDEVYWSKRYKNNETGWDIGEVSKPLLKLFDHIESKDDYILIPGCGNAYEAEYLFECGYENIYIIDIAEEPISAFKSRNPNFPENQILLGDFFKHTGSYNVIIEQTFFCAIDPELRPNYVHKCYELLKNNGRLLGVLFNREFDGGPPFGGNEEEYKSIFEKVFSTVHIMDSIHSIKPRLGNEVIINCVK